MEATEGENFEKCNFFKSDWKKKLKNTFHLVDQCQLDFETELFTRCMDAYGRGVRLYSKIIKKKGRELQKEDSYSNFKCEFGE